MATPDFISIIREKNERIDAIPERFMTGVKKSEQAVFQSVLDLLSQMEIRNGQFVASVRNIEIASRITEQLKGALAGSEFSDALVQFASEFDKQAAINIRYFEKAFGIAAAPEIIPALVETAKRNAVDLLVNSAFESEVTNPLRDIIEQSVINNSSYTETLQAIEDFVYGNEVTEGRLMSYSRTISHDAFAVADRSVVANYSKEFEFEWYLYAGGEIKTTRPFCQERIDGYYHIKEIEAWGEGKKTTGLKWPQKGTWGGQIKGTTAANILSYAGGYNCGHTMMPTSIFAVPKTTVQRVIDQGFYTPSDEEREQLGLD